MRRIMSFSVKAIISVLLLYLALRGVDLGSIKARLGSLDFRWMTLIFFILCAQLALAALRWRQIVVICGARLPLAAAVNYTFSGQFFNQVLPSTVGGDAVRVWLLARRGAGWPSAIYSVFTDRLVGVSVLAALVVACLPWSMTMIHDLTARAALAVIGFGALAGVMGFVMLGAMPLRLMERWWLTRHLAVVSRLAWRLCRSVTGAQVVGLSFVIHLMTVTIVWGAAMATHAAVDFIDVLILVFPVMLIATLPVSIAGWGLRESAMVLAFSYAGLANSDGLIISILFGLVNLMVGVIGGIVWVASGYRWRSIDNIETATPADA
jgi:uncharacterized membrane protein YbhN (UPF0104 family)